MKKTIIITTDFGDSFAAAQLQAVVSSLGFDGNLIENHSVSSFSILEGAFQISVISRFSPPGSVHVGVVDPGVGSQRAGIAIQSAHHWFVGPDNGLLYPAALSDEIISVWRLEESHISDYVSNTFHGRDVFIKAAVYLAQGRHPIDFGSKPLSISDVEALSFGNGQVLHIDHYGNTKVHWIGQIQLGGKLNLKRNNEVISLPIVKTFSEVPTGVPLALVGSSNTLELAINLGNFAKEHSLKVGNLLEINI